MFSKFVCKIDMTEWCLDSKRLMMPQPSDKKLSYINTLENWQWRGFITFHERAMEWARVHLEIIDDRILGRMMYEYVKAGGEIDQKKEKRPTTDWKDDNPKSLDYLEFLYELRIPFGGKVVYFETRFDDPGDPDDATIHVVNIHESK